MSYHSVLDGFTAAIHPSVPRRGNNFPGRLMVRPTLILMPALAAQLFAGTAAVPLPPSTWTNFSLRRDSGSNGQDPNQNPGLQIQIWIPIVIIIFLLLVTVVGFFHRRRIALGISQSRRGTNVNIGAGRELTAEQLAGSILAGSGNANATNGTRTRRTRRPRRTPSQISTTSLPAYAKEPGEQEVVIFRGPGDMEDASMPNTVIMESLAEDAEESMHSPDLQRYSPMPHTPADEPLLQGEHLRASNDVVPRSSVDSQHSLDGSPLTPHHSATLGYEETPRDEVPGYYEVVDVNQDSSNNNTTSTVTSASPSSPPGVLPQRFRNILNVLPNRLSMASRPESPVTHSRAASAFSIASTSELHQGRESSQSRTSHHTRASTSSSFFNLTPFRTHSHQKSLTNGNLTSPSLISLNSISAPLAHTLTRTEFTYPKSGPTPEQMKLISSRESFARFGVPYGPDAIAFASSSRQDMTMPPPSFDEQLELSGYTVSAGASRQQSPSSTTASSRDMVEETPAITSISHDPVQADREASVEGSGPERLLHDQDPASLPLPPSPKPSGISSLATEMDAVADIEMGRLPFLKDKPSLASRWSRRTLNRPESRASSVQTFATAVESVGRRSEESDMSAPATPRLGVMHYTDSEASDATVTLGAAGHQRW